MDAMTSLNLGTSPIKWRQRPDMTTAVDWDVNIPLIGHRDVNVPFMGHRQTHNPRCDAAERGVPSGDILFA